jgi:hypothetical protein
MKKLSMAACVALALAAPVAQGDNDRNQDKFRTRLIGLQEVPVVSTVARGQFEAEIADNEQSIDFELSYEGLQGVVTQAHIHVAQKGVNGVIVAFLCGTVTNPGPAGTQVCPQTVPENMPLRGTITAAQVIVGANTQQLATGELAEVIAAMRSGVVYANVHTNLSPGGEIRGQVRPRNHKGGHDRGNDRGHHHH